MTDFWALFGVLVSYRECHAGVNPKMTFVRVWMNRVDTHISVGNVSGSAVVSFQLQVTWNVSPGLTMNGALVSQRLQIGLNAWSALHPSSVGEKVLRTRRRG